MEGTADWDWLFAGESNAGCNRLGGKNAKASW
jgi:hypothetical protein